MWGEWEGCGWGVGGGQAWVWGGGGMGCLGGCAGSDSVFSVYSGSGSMVTWFGGCMCTLHYIGHCVQIGSSLRGHVLVSASSCRLRN